VIVPADAIERLRSRGREELALQACHPRFSAKQRYIVYARPVRVIPRGGLPAYSPGARGRVATRPPG
jgi:sortase (surface protein transpeptidase)